MKLRTSKREQGNALAITLIIALAIGLALGSYLRLVSSQNVSTMRSLAWNAAIPVLEAGIEEALTQIYHNGITNLSANDWTFDGTYYTKSRTMGDCYYNVSVEPVEPPVIVADGYVPAPFNPATQFGFFAAVTGADLVSTGTAYVGRKVRCTTQRDGLFAKGMVAEGDIDLRGKNIKTDSYDSSLPQYSDNGAYPYNYPDRTRSNGDVATNSQLINSLDVGNAKIKGHLATGPGGEVEIGPLGSVGQRWWVENGFKGIQPGHLTDDMNVDFPPVKLPFTSGYSVPGAQTIGGTNYNYVMGSGNYQLSSFGGSVLVAGNATLVVTDSVSFTGIDQILIAPGASLKLYVSASSAVIGGNGVVNQNGNPISFQYYGLPTNTSLAYAGNGSFTGVVYAPNADYHLGGGGNDTYDFVGASVTKTVNMNGHYNFHYDEALAKYGPLRAYILASWNEI